MPKIIKLSSEIIPKIAAGEVVERPVSVVKELVENALDANAGNILIEVAGGGLKKIRIVDDGAGMDRADLENCFLPHTTSKISTLEDLAQIHTLGFRGEALSSICAVSDVTIKTRTGDALNGNAIEITNSKVQPVVSVAMAAGTSIEVRDLFNSFPARKKFLKSENTEFQYILNLVNAYVLANLQTGFELVRDNKTVFKINSTENIVTRIEKLFGQNVANNLLPLNYIGERLKLSGFISKPQIANSTKTVQLLFVNGRVVFDQKIAVAIKKAYKTLLDAHSYPLFMLFLNLDYGLVDVNIHPQKERVKFWDDAAVYNAVYTAVETVLSQTDLSFRNAENPMYKIDTKAAGQVFYTLKDSSTAWQVRDEPQEEYGNTIQIADTYIAYTQNNKLMLVDQHAAHESILYAQFTKDFLESVDKITQYRFEVPLILNLPLSQKNLLIDNLEHFRKLSFEIEPLKDLSIRISAIPQIFKDHDLAKLITELLEDISEDSLTRDIDSKTKRTIAYLACRTAIKAGDKLNADERKRLLTMLDENPGLYTCPHGRPIKITISARELERMFKRV